MPLQPPNPAGPAPAPGDSDYSISLAPNLSLAIRHDSLHIQDGRADTAKKSRTCGFGSSGPSQPPTPRRIPLYNILWAELDSAHHALTIDYAREVSRTSRRAAKLSLPLSPEASPPEAATAESISEWVQHLMARSYGPAPRKRRAYVLVNPHAGPGGAAKIWESQVKPIFDAARMALTIHRTTFSGEAVGLVENIDIDQFDIIVPCSGDGLPHEIFNGLARRPDATRALHKLAVAHIPCGSGNALACNAFGTHRPSLAALAVVKGVATPLDLISITQGDRRILSFLSQTLGIMAEADLGTEHLRWMGEHRFTYGVITRILKKKVYPCDLWAKVDIGHKDGVRDHYRRERENSSILELDNMTASPAPAPATHASGALSSVADSDDAKRNDDATTGLPPLKYGTVNDKLPQGWEKLEADQVGNFYCGNVAYMAPDVVFFNAAWLNDGLMDLVTVDGDVPTPKAPGLLLSVGNNSFFDNPLVTYRKVSAFRIVPKDQKDGYISIDGEKVPFEPFQAEVHQGLGMVITKRGVMEHAGPRNWDRVTTSQRLMA